MVPGAVAGAGVVEEREDVVVASCHRRPSENSSCRPVGKLLWRLVIMSRVRLCGRGS